MSAIPISRIPRFYADRFGDSAALIQDDDLVSWEALDRRSTRLAWGLRERGVGQDHLVLVALPNSNAFYEITFAIWKAGAIPHIVSWRLPEPEFAAIVDLARPKVIVTQSETFNQAFGGLTPSELQTSRDASLPEVVSRYWKAMSSGGSTGRPKIIVDHTPSEIDPAETAVLLPHGGSVLNPGPLYHNAPFLFMHSALFQGNTVVGMAKFDAEETLRLIERHKINWINMVPTMMSRIWRLPEAVRNRYDLSSLQAIWHMAAPMPPWLKKEWIGWLGPERIWELYGGTEGTGRTVINGVEWLQHVGSVGRPVADCEVRIVDEHGVRLPRDTIGEIYFVPTSDEPPYHYIGAESRRGADGAESLGDFGWLSDDGYLYLADRRVDLIISGGSNIYPAEVEGALMEHPGVEVAVVIGLPHEDLGASVHAIVRPRQDWSAPLDAEVLAAHVREKLALYKTPRSYEFTEDELRDDAGKVRRTKLRDDRIARLSAATGDRIDRPDS